MSRCPKCSYKLILLSNRPKYKCALCSKLYPEKEIELRDFLEWNKQQKTIETEQFIQEELGKLMLKKKIEHLGHSEKSSNLKHININYQKKKNWRKNTSIILKTKIR